MPWDIKGALRHNKKLTKKQAEVWVKVANSALDRCLKNGGKTSECEASAIMQANAVVKNIKEEEDKMEIDNQKIEEKVWSTKYINDLPDSCFAYIEPGGKKDEEGKTKPRSLRHFPYKDKDGKIDLPHLRNALARVPQSPFGKLAMPKLLAAAKKMKIGKFKEEDAREGALADELVFDKGKGEIDDLCWKTSSLVGRITRSLELSLDEKKKKIEEVLNDLEKELKKRAKIVDKIVKQAKKDKLETGIEP